MVLHCRSLHSEAAIVALLATNRVRPKDQVDVAYRVLLDHFADCSVYCGQAPAGRNWVSASSQPTLSTS